MPANLQAVLSRFKRLLRIRGKRRDREIVEMFLRGHNASFGTSYQVQEWAEDVERQRPVVETIATDVSGSTMAIEHTLLEAFKGEKSDAQAFLSIFGPLEEDQSLVVPEYLIVLAVQPHAIPRGVDRDEIRGSVLEWFRQNRETLPNGDSTSDVPNLSFRLSLGIHKLHTPGITGMVLVSRFLPAGSTEPVLRRAFSRKLPKLADTGADKCIFVLEKDYAAHGFSQIRETIRTIEHEFPRLADIDEIWMADTVTWENARIVYFFRVWPDGDIRWFKEQRVPVLTSTPPSEAGAI